ncbi:hypothetical protein [Sphingomonas mesophila]|uniref:hypothetical protein n=1 Tax=Sphingomonas mesophila TaxID=2303576 RepID=UPI0013C2A026|nr:hypothetical protein [Sphingomonas mesophila]
MLSLDDFASLAQFGAGLAFALTIFIEPITVRAQRVRQAIHHDLLLLPKDGADESRLAESNLWVRLTNLERAVKEAHRLAKMPMSSIKFGAATNFVLLLAATVCPDSEVSTGWMWFLLTLSVVPVAIGIMWVQALAVVRVKKPE